MGPNRYGSADWKLICADRPNSIPVDQFQAMDHITGDNHWEAAHHRRRATSRTGRGDRDPTSPGMSLHDHLARPGRGAGHGQQGGNCSNDPNVRAVSTCDGLEKLFRGRSQALRQVQAILQGIRLSRGTAH